MEPWLIKALMDHAHNVTPYLPPDQWYVAYFLDDVEVDGGDYARQPIDLAAAEVLLDEVTSASAIPQFFTGLPTTDVDEVRLMTALTGGVAGYRIPWIHSFTAGDEWGHAPGKIRAQGSRVA